MAPVNVQLMNAHYVLQCQHHLAVWMTFIVSRLYSSLYDINLSLSLSHKFQVFPIFIISIADFLLALTWVVGGALWFTRISQRVWCFLPSLLTVVGYELRKSWCVANMIAHVNHLPTDLSMCHC